MIHFNLNEFKTYMLVKPQEEGLTLTYGGPEVQIQKHDGKTDKHNGKFCGCDLDFRATVYYLIVVAVNFGTCGKHMKYVFLRPHGAIKYKR